MLAQKNTCNIRQHIPLHANGCVCRIEGSLDVWTHVRDQQTEQC